MGDHWREVSDRWGLVLLHVLAPEVSAGCARFRHQENWRGGVDSFRGRCSWMPRRGRPLKLAAAPRLFGERLAEIRPGPERRPDAVGDAGAARVCGVGDLSVQSRFFRSTVMVHSGDDLANR